jgi:hypothetical protein
MDSIQAIIDLYKKDVDVTLLEENLKKTVEERIRSLQSFEAFREELRAETASAVRPKRANTKRRSDTLGHWLIRGYDSQTLIAEIRVSFAQIAPRRLESLLKALTAKVCLSFDEIVGAYASKGTRIANDLLAVTYDHRTNMYSCGTNPYFIAKRVPNPTASLQEALRSFPAAPSLPREAPQPASR